MVYPYNGILFSLKKEATPDTRYRMNLEDITLREISQTPKDKYCRIPFMWGP